MDLLLSFLPVFPLLGAFSSHRRYDLYYLIIFVLLFVLVTFRHIYVGTDTYNYYLQYARIKGDHAISIEPLWFLLNHVVIYFGGSFQMVLALANALILIPIFWIAKKRSPNKYLTIFFYLSLYLFFYAMNITRQTVAMSIVFIALSELVNRNHLRYIFLVVIASLFHVSAIVCLPLVFISKVPIRLTTHILMVVSSMIIGLFLHERLLSYALSLMYSNYDDFNLEFGNFLGNLFFLIILNSFYFFIYWSSKDKDSLFKLFFVYILVMNVFIRIPFGMRIVLYFSMIQLLFYPYLIYNNRLPYKGIMAVVLIVFAFCIFAMNFGHGEILPFKFFSYE